MRLRAAFFILVLLSDCALSPNTTRVMGEAGGSSRGPVPVYFALSPPFAYDVIGDVSANLDGDRAHLEDLIGEAETRARSLNADAIVIREARSDARLVSQQIWRTCVSPGPAGRSFQYSCPDVIQTLLVDGRLNAVAVRRRTNAPAGDARWPLPPPLASTGPLPTHATPNRDDGPTLEEDFGHP